MTVRRSPQPTYRPIIKTAISRLFHERDLWLFGFFAFFVTSASSLEPVIRASQALQNPRTNFLDSLFPFLEAVRQWTAQIPVGAPGTVMVQLTILALFVLALLFAGVISQGALLHGTKKHGKRVTPLHMIQKVRTHFWGLFALDVLLKLLIAVAFVMFLAPTPVTTPLFSPFLTGVKNALGLVWLFGSTLTILYAMTALVNHNQTLGAALREGWRVFRTHIIASIELSLLLFAIALGIGVAAIGALLILFVPYTILFLWGAQMGSLFATTLATTAMFFVVFALSLTFAGLTTALNYTVIGVAYETLRKNKLATKVQRVKDTLRWF